MQLTRRAAASSAGLYRLTAMARWVNGSLKPKNSGPLMRCPVRCAMHTCSGRAGEGVTWQCVAVSCVARHTLAPRYMRATLPQALQMPAVVPKQKALSTAGPHIRPRLGGGLAREDSPRLLVNHLQARLLS